MALVHQSISSPSRQSRSRLALLCRLIAWQAPQWMWKNWEAAAVVVVVVVAIVDVAVFFPVGEY